MFNDKVHVKGSQYLYLSINLTITKFIAFNHIIDAAK